MTTEQSGMSITSVVNTIDACTAAAAKVIAVYLTHRYASMLGEPAAVPLAVAVTNELFGVPPGNEQARQFFSSNTQTVNGYLLDLKKEAEVCRIVSVLLHTKFNVAAPLGIVTPEMVSLAAKLRNAGILLPVDSIRLPMSPEALVAEMRVFERSALFGDRIQ